MKGRTHEEFVSLLKSKTDKIEVLGVYEKSHVKIQVKCLVCGHIWYASPSNLLKGHGCPLCAKKSITKTHEEFVSQMHNINPKIDIIGNYIKDNVKIDVKCNVCGHEWKPKPSNLIQGFGCPKCYEKSRLNTHDDFLLRMKSINKDISIIGKYTGANNKILCRCNICSHEWSPKANALLSGHGCPECFHNSRRKSHNDFVNQLNEINPDITIIGEYKNNKTKIKCKCDKCGYVWETAPTQLLSGRGCRKCATSKGEKKIMLYLKENNIDYFHQHTFDDCKDIKLLPFDFYIPENNTVIEYDGEQHFRPVDYFGGIEKYQIGKRHDEIKNQYCNDNNINLIRIPYTDFNNISYILDNKLSI